MEERHIIAVYCRFRDDDKVKNTGDYAEMFPGHVINRIKKASEVYSRIVASHADSEYTKIVFFGQDSIETLKEYANSIGLPTDKIALDQCKDIATMAKKVWEDVRHLNVPPRVYFVVSNWQWIFLNPLIGTKDERYRFYFEGAVDTRHTSEIDKDKKMEKVAKIDLREGRLASILDKIGGNVSENMKG